MMGDCSLFLILIILGLPIVHYDKASKPSLPPGSICKGIHIFFHSLTCIINPVAFAKKSNEKVLRKIGLDKNLLKWIKNRQMRLMGHVIKKEKLEHLSLTGLIPGKRAWGRQR